MATVGIINIAVRAGVDQLGKDLARAQAAFANLGSTIARKITIPITDVASGVINAAKDIGQFAIDSLKGLDQTAEAAQQIGTTTEELTALRYAAQLTGSDMEALDPALRKMNDNLGNAAMSGGPVEKLLNRMGLSAKDLVKIDPGLAFEAIVKGFETLPTQADKASAAMDIFGKGGQAILNTLTAGADTISEFKDRAAKLGIVFDSKDVASISAANDAMDNMWFILKGLGNQIAVAVAPYVTELGKQLVVLAQNSGPFIDKFGQFLKLMFGMPNLSSALGFGTGGGGGGEAAAASAEKAVGATQRASLATRTWGEDQAKLQDDTEKLREKLETSAATFGMTSEQVEIYKLAQQGASAATIEQLTALSKEVEAQKEQQKVIDAILDANDAMRVQIDTYGLAERAVERYKLAQQGATEEQLAHYDALSKELDTLEASKKSQEDQAAALEEQRKQAKSIYEETRTPMEAFHDKVKELVDLRDAGVLSPQTFKRAVDQAGHGLADTTKFAGAMEFGSTEARSTLLQYQGLMSQKDSGLEMVAQVENEILAENQKQSQWLGEMAEAFRNAKTPEEQEDALIQAMTGGTF